MKTKGILTKRFFCEYNELDSMAEFIEKKAAEGWELTSKTGTALGFRRCEPKQIKVSVELVPQGGDEEDRERFVQLCESTGWKHIFSDGKLQFFAHEDLAAEPIHTDPKIKLDVIHKKCIGMKIVGPLIMSMLLAMLWLKIQLPLDIYDMMQYSSIINLFVIPLFSVAMLVYTLDYLIWYKNAKARVEKGEKPIYKTSKISASIDKLVQISIFVFLWGGIFLDNISANDSKALLATIIMFVAVILFIILFPIISAKHSADKKGNFAMYMGIGILVVIGISFFEFVYLSDDNYVRVEDIDGAQVIVAHDEIPVTLEDLGIKTTGYVDRYKVEEGTFLLTNMSASDNSQNDEDYYLQYDVYKTKYQSIYEKVLNEELYEYTDERDKIEDNAFGANEVYYSRAFDEYVLLYDDTIIELSTNVELTDEQKKSVVEKLI